MTSKEVLQFIQANADKFCFNKYFSEYTQEELLEDVLKDCNLPFEFSIASGISKAVMLIKGEEYVIKFPFRSLFEEDDYDDACYRYNNEDEYPEQKEEPDVEDYYYNFDCANHVAIPMNRLWDYCELESAIYEEAVDQGLGAYFAEEYLLGFVNDQPVYRQTRCVACYDYEQKYSDDEYEKKSSYSREKCKELNCNCFNPIWIADFIERYGEAEFKRLNAFLNEYEIGDLRSCNIGYLDDAPILFDYSGFRDYT